MILTMMRRRKTKITKNSMTSEFLSQCVWLCIYSSLAISVDSFAAIVNKKKAVMRKKGEDAGEDEPNCSRPAVSDGSDDEE